MNIFIAKASFAKLNSCLFYAWRKGLKTGMYYLRSKAASEANQFGIDINKIKELEAKYHILSETQKTTIVEPTNFQEMLPCKLIPKHLRKLGDCNVCGS
jgi:ribonucleotide reductase alpha subunit